jgi:hypothetical protein
MNKNISIKKIRIFVNKKPDIRVVETYNNKKEWLVEISDYGSGELEV